MATTTTKEKAQTPAEKPEVTEEQEQTPEERLAGLIKEEGIRHAEGVNLIELLTDLQGKGMVIAKKVRNAKKAEAGWRQTISTEVLLPMRQSILLPSGVPDWAGRTKTYKDAVSPIIGAAHYDGEGDSLVTTSNALNKACQRLLPDFVAQYTATLYGIDMAEEAISSFVKEGPAVLEKVAKEGADERLVELVERVNEQYRAQWAGEAEKPRNTPTSPFEPKESRSRTTPTGEEADAATQMKAAMALVELIRKGGITLEAATEIIWRASDAVLTRAQSKSPHYGDGGKPVTLGFVNNAVVILTAVGKHIEEVPLGKAEQNQLNDALVS